LTGGVGGKGRYCLNTEGNSPVVYDSRLEHAPEAEGHVTGETRNTRHGKNRRAGGLKEGLDFPHNSQIEDDAHAVELRQALREAPEYYADAWLRLTTFRVDDHGLVMAAKVLLLLHSVFHV
jgi:hypothetical protein